VCSITIAGNLARSTGPADIKVLEIHGLNTCVARRAATPSECID
jgi:hypothetical protein